MTVYLPPLFMIVGKGSTLPTVLDCWGLNFCKSRKESFFCHFIIISSPLSVTFFLYENSWFHFTCTRFVFSARVCWWNPVKVCCLCLLYHSWPQLPQLQQHMDGPWKPVQLWICHPHPVPIGQNNRWLKNESPVPAVWVSHMFLGNLVLFVQATGNFTACSEPHPFSVLENEEKEMFVICWSVGEAPVHPSAKIRYQFLMLPYSSVP